MIRHLKLLKYKVINNNKNELFLLLFSLLYAVYWLAVSPLQYNGDSEGYLGIAHLLLGQSAGGIAPIYRAPGYPLVLLLTGAVFPGTFIPILLLQALFSAIIPVIIFKIVLPYGQKIAFITAITAVLTGTMTIHISQIMTESLFTFLLFVGLYLLVTLIRKMGSTYFLFYLLALVFAALNSVRPFAWLIFWSFQLVLIVYFYHKERITFLWKHLLGSSLLFMSCMFFWSIVDDVFFSVGANYSPLVPARVGSDNFLVSYLYDIPFNETYFEPWHQKVQKTSKFFVKTDIINNRTGMEKIYRIVLNFIILNQERLFSEKSVYPYHLYGQFSANPKQLADRIFALPNHSYANFVNLAMEASVSHKERLALYHKVAKESGYDWPTRWLKRWQKNPFFLFTGPTHGSGPNRFLLAYTSLRNYVPDPSKINYHSLVNPQNGPASRLLFSVLNEALQNSPELWQTSSLFGRYIGNPEGLTREIVNFPNQRYAWDITVMLWDLMGYNTMSDLLNYSAEETFISHKSSLFLRFWDTILMVLAGPGYIEIDHLGPQFGAVEIYDYLETSLLSKHQKKEMHFMQHHYQEPFSKFQAPMQLGYFLFYLTKPFFFIFSLLSVAILWSRKKSIIEPIILLLPYCISVLIYGTLFTALPRYTDPTLLLPLMITLLVVPECLSIWRDRQHMRMVTVL